MYTQAQLDTWKTGNFTNWMRVYDPNKPLPKNLYSFASKIMDLRSLEWLDEKHYSLEKNDLLNIVCYENTEALEWLSNHNYQIHETILFYAMHKNMEEFVFWSVANSKWELAQSVIADDIEELQENINKGLNDTGIACCIAAYYGYIECLELLHESNISWNKQTPYAAAIRGNMTCLQYACENGCSFDCDIINSAVPTGNLELIEYLLTKGCSCTPHIAALAANWGHMHIINWYYANGYQFDINACASAAETDETEIIKWLVGKGCQYNHESVLGCLERCPTLAEWFEENGYYFQEPIQRYDRNQN